MSHGLAAWYSLFTPVDLTNVSDQVETAQCLNSANQFTADFDAKINDLAKNWTPPDTFSSTEVRQIVQAVMGAIQKAQKVVDQAAGEPNANQGDLAQSTDDLARHGGQSLNYLDSANQADSAGANSAISAPGLKTWVTNSLSAASSAVVVAYVVGCQKPWWVSALSEFQSAFDYTYNIVRNTVGFVIDAATKVVKAVEASIGFVAWLIKYGPWIGAGVLGLGAVLLAHNHMKGGKPSDLLTADGIKNIFNS